MIDKRRLVIFNNTNCDLFWSKKMNNIAHWRSSANLTQVQLAKACGWGEKQSRISNYEQGTRAPTISVCRKIVNALNACGAKCTLDDVFPSLPTASRD